MSAIKTYPRGQISVLRHKGVSPELTSYGIAFTYTKNLQEEKSDYTEAMAEMLDRIKGKQLAPIDSKWPTPNFQEIAEKLSKVNKLELLIRDYASSLSAEASNNWEACSISRGNTVLSRKSNTPVDIVCNDLDDACFSVRLREQFGIVVVEPIENAAPPRVKYWEMAVLRKLINDNNGAYGWWEYD